jgi:hypothetical protein
MEMTLEFQKWIIMLYYSVLLRHKVRRSVNSDDGAYLTQIRRVQSGKIAKRSSELRLSELVPKRNCGSRQS